MNTTTVIWTAPEEAMPGAGRKRVGKACNRCRLKKCKCDGLSACSRCIADNAICSFERQKKPQHKRPVPDGYVEMLEEQRTKLVSGLCEMYKRLQNANAWNGPPLSEAGGNPLTHEILAALNILTSEDNDEDSSDEFDTQSSRGTRSASVVGSSESDQDSESVGSGSMMPASISPGNFSPSCAFVDAPTPARAMRPELQTHHSMPTHLSSHQLHQQQHHLQHTSHPSHQLAVDPVFFQDDYSLDLDRSAMQHSGMDFSLLESALHDSGYATGYNNLSGYNISNLNDALHLMAYNHNGAGHMHLDSMEV